MRHAPIVVAIAVLTACAYPGYVHDEYRHIPLVTFAHDNNSFRIFDKPSAGKLIITPSLATAGSDLVIRNVTFGEYNNATDRRTLEAAVAAYLASAGRKCTVIDGAPIYDPQWEFIYTCEANYTAQP